jgi:hypothetical protein
MYRSRKAYGATSCVRFSGWSEPSVISLADITARRESVIASQVGRSCTPPIRTPSPVYHAYAASGRPRRSVTARNKTYSPSISLTYQTVCGCPRSSSEPVSAASPSPSHGRRPGARKSRSMSHRLHGRWATTSIELMCMKWRMLYPKKVKHSPPTPAADGSTHRRRNRNVPPKISR